LLSAFSAIFCCLCFLLTAALSMKYALSFRWQSRERECFFHLLCCFSNWQLTERRILSLLLLSSAPVVVRCMLSLLPALLNLFICQCPLGVSYGHAG
jgi:hypothetical protein